MKKRKVFCSFMITAALIVGVTACGQESGQASASEISDSAESGASQEAAQTGSEEDGGEKIEESRDILGIGAETLFGKITAIGGSTITLALAERPGMPDGREPSDKWNPDGSAPADNQNPDGSAPADNQKADGSAPADNQNPGGNAPTENQKPAGNLPAGGGQPAEELTLTGDTRVLTVTEETIITINNASATLSELSVDDVITVFMEEDTLNSITVEDFGAEGGRDKGPGESGREKPASGLSNVKARTT